jgi:hypothetical protein
VRDLIEPTCADPIGALLIFLDLLKRDPKGCGQLRLTHVSLVPRSSQALTNMNVDFPGAAGTPVWHTFLPAGA